AGIEPLQREINLRVQGWRVGGEVNLLEDRQVNAFSLPGRKIAVFTGMFDAVEHAGQVALLLSHEISPARAHHSNERAGQARDAERGGGPGMLGFLKGKKYERQQEAEADKIGVFLMTFAGYDPREAVAFWQRMQEAPPGGGLPEILSDHP